MKEPSATFSAASLNQLGRSMQSLGDSLKRRVSSKRHKPKLRRLSTGARSLRRGSKAKKATQVTLENVLVATNDPDLDVYMRFTNPELESAFQAGEAGILQRNAIVQACSGAALAMLFFIVLLISGDMSGTGESLLLSAH